MVFGEVLGELEVGVVGAVHQAADHTGLLEHRKVPVGGALREFGIARKQFGQRHGGASTRKHLDDPAATVGVALLTAAETVVDGPVEVVIAR